MSSPLGGSVPPLGGSLTFSNCSPLGLGVSSWLSWVVSFSLSFPLGGVSVLSVGLFLPFVVVWFSWWWFGSSPDVVVGVVQLFFISVFQLSLLVLVLVLLYLYICYIGVVGLCVFVVFVVFNSYLIYIVVFVVFVVTLFI